MPSASKCFSCSIYCRTGYKSLIGEPASWWDRLNETRLRFPMPVLTDQINSSWFWTCMKVGFVAGILVKEGLRTDALYQAVCLIGCSQPYVRMAPASDWALPVGLQNL